MPVETECDVERGIAIRRVLGEMSAEEALDAMRNSYLHPDFVIGMDSLWDIRQGSLAKLTSEGILEIVRFSAAAVKKRGTGWKTALVAPNDLEFGMLRMLEVLASGLPGSFCVFRDYDEALAWLAEPTAQE